MTQRSSATLGGESVVGPWNKIAHNYGSAVFRSQTRVLFTLRSSQPEQLRPER